MKIILMRHGQVAVPEFNQRIPASQFQNCLELYDRCGIVEDDWPSNETKSALRGCALVISSDLRRAIESATRITPAAEQIRDPLFREVTHPYINIPWLRLHPQTWGKLFIALWWLGLLGGLRAFREAKHRARQCAQRLEHWAEKHHTVLLVGHGFMNTYIAKELLLLGWAGPGMPSKNYWEFGVYQKHP